MAIPPGAAPIISQNQKWITRIAQATMASSAVSSLTV